MTYNFQGLDDTKIRSHLSIYELSLSKVVYLAGSGAGAKAGVDVFAGSVLRSAFSSAFGSAFCSALGSTGLAVGTTVQVKEVNITRQEDDVLIYHVQKSRDTMS